MNTILALLCAGTIFTFLATQWFLSFSTRELRGGIIKQEKIEELKKKRQELDDRFHMEEVFELGRQITELENSNVSSVFGIVGSCCLGLFGQIQMGILSLAVIIISLANKVGDLSIGLLALASWLGVLGYNLLVSPKRTKGAKEKAEAKGEKFVLPPPPAFLFYLSMIPGLYALYILITIIAG